MPVPLFLLEILCPPKVPGQIHFSHIPCLLSYNFRQYQRLIAKNNCNKCWCIEAIEAEQRLFSNDSRITWINLFLSLNLFCCNITPVIFSTSIDSTVTSPHITICVQVHIKLGVQIIDYKYSSQCGQILILKNKIFNVFSNTLNINWHAVHKFTHLFTVVKSY